MSKTDTRIECVFGNYLLKHDSLNMVVVLSASLVIKECEKWSPDEELNNYPEDNNTPLGYMVDKVRWAQHGFINALQSHVEIIYAYQEAVLNKKLIYPEYEEALLICKALDIYQNWKMSIAGGTIGFKKAVWNDNNDKFLDSYRRQ